MDNVLYKVRALYVEFCKKKKTYSRLQTVI